MQRVNWVGCIVNPYPAFILNGRTDHAVKRRPRHPREIDLPQKRLVKHVGRSMGEATLVSGVERSFFRRQRRQTHFIWKIRGKSFSGASHVLLEKAWPERLFPGHFWGTGENSKARVSRRTLFAGASPPSIRALAQGLGWQSAPMLSGKSVVRIHQARFRGRAACCSQGLTCAVAPGPSAVLPPMFFVLSFLTPASARRLTRVLFYPLISC